MKSITKILALALGFVLILGSTACSPSEIESTSEIPQTQAADVETSEALPGGRCGDGVCDGPEDEKNCPQDCTPTEAAPEEKPVEPPPVEEPAAVPPGESPCGDGVCDEVEHKDPSLCPQDCEGDSAYPAPGHQVPVGGFGPDYEPPINVVLILHSDPDMSIDSFTFKAEPRDTQRTRQGIDLLLEEAARHNLRFSVLYNGWYPKESLESGDLSQFQALLDAGHEIGTHAHRLTYDPGTDIWTAHVEDLSFYGRPNYDPAVARQTWEDATVYVDEVLQQLGITDQNKIMSTRSFTFKDEGDLMQEYGFTVAAGDRAEISIAYFGHMVWNPWRPAANDELGYELTEDLKARFITLDHLAQIGSHEVSHDVNLTVPQLQRRFLMLYAEWFSRVRTGAEDKVWTFGFVYHPNYTDRYMADLSQFLTWLDQNFINQTTPQGYTIARYATVGEIAQEFEAWETTYPGVSSFNYVRGDPYPYTYPVIPTSLEGASLEASINLGDGITCYRFVLENKPVYMMWSNQGEVIVDLSGEIQGQVQLKDMAGEETIMNSNEISLSEEPIIVTPLQ